jgi:uncharacterized protein (TIGR02466 family)
MGQEKPPFAVTLLPGAEALNGRLRRALLDMAASVPDKVTTMRSGRPSFDNRWLSHTRLHLEGPPVFAELAAAIEAAAEQKVRRRGDEPPLRIDTMWSIVSRAEMVGRRHNHSGRVSIAYYVDAGSTGPVDGGLLQFHKDAAQAAPSYAVAPQAGLLVIFPSSLYHSVSRYRGTAPRIVVSANLS